MPEISRFLGIVIAMFYRDHEPPHFYAIYGDHQITVEIADGRITGEFSGGLHAMFKSGAFFIGKSCSCCGRPPVNGGL